MKHNSAAALISHPATHCRRESPRRNPAHRGASTIRRTLSAIFIVLSIVTAFAAFGVPVNTSWTYQGQLRRSGAAYNGTCNFQFSLWNAASAGTQQGNTLPINSVNVANGLFTVVLDFGDAFTGDARWLATSVQCTGDPGFTPLDPRQPLTAAPYALSLRPGASIVGDTPAFAAALLAESLSADGFGLIGFGHDGVYGSSSDNSGTGVSGSGRLGVYGRTLDPFGRGVYGESNGAGSNTAGVFGLNSTGPAIWGQSTGNGPAVYGQNTNGGPAGKFVGPVTVENSQLTVTNSGDVAIYGTGLTGLSGFSNTTNGKGVQGSAQGPGSIGVYGTTDIGAAIKGISFGSGSAIFGQNNFGGLAGHFVGTVLVEGTLIKSAGSFRIDHPLDPANKFLSHSFVESPDMKNIYDGNVTTDATGSAIVTLPAYFEALNRDYRYQLTVLGQFAQAIVSREIAQNSFEIHTDKPGVKVSWQVTGIRQDAYARANPIVPEEFKPAEEQGLYLFPAGFGAGEEKQIGAPSRPAPTQDAQGPTGASQGVQAPCK